MNPAKDRSALIGVVAVVVGPSIGFAVMAAIWSLAETWGRGGIDYGVVTAGAAASALSIGLTGRLAGQSLRSLAPWIAVGFLTVVLAGSFAISTYISVMPDFGDID